ncbi:Uncharacterised protein [Myroides odoratus]|nr:hypothetical protein HMPREF9716_02757 [Myroides odoratus CIP 103059]STZ31445.1 Uncharacterised protein [Myroides odoratus]
MRYVRYSLGIVSLLLLFFLLKYNGTTRFAKEPKLLRSNIDSLDSKALQAPLYEEYLRVKFDHCTP